MADLMGMSKPKMPEARPTTAMPDPEDERVKRAGTRKREEEVARTGRASTDLSGAPTTYGNDVLGRG